MTDLGWAILLFLYRAWGIAVLWHWFAQPLGWGHVTLPTAIGLSCVIAFFTTRVPGAANQDQAQRNVESLFVTSSLLLVGTLTHLAAG